MQFRTFTLQSFVFVAVSQAAMEPPLERIYPTRRCRSKVRGLREAATNSTNCFKCVWHVCDVCLQFGQRLGHKFSQLTRLTRKCVRLFGGDCICRPSCDRTVEAANKDVQQEVRVPVRRQPRQKVVMTEAAKKIKNEQRRGRRGVEIAQRNKNRKARDSRRLVHEMKRVQL